MSSNPGRSMTLEELYRLPDDGCRYELHRGCLVSEPAPGGRHGRIEVVLSARLLSHVRSRRCGVVLHHVAFVLARNPDTIRVPDLAYVRRDRYEALDDEALPIPGVPDLAVEVLSPSNRPMEMQRKVSDYLDAGTGLVWVVDPVRQSVACITQAQHHILLAGHDVLTGAPVLEQFRLPVADIFEMY